MSWVVAAVLWLTVVLLAALLLGRLLVRADRRQEIASRPRPPGSVAETQEPARDPVKEPARDPARTPVTNTATSEVERRTEQGPEPAPSSIPPV